MIGCESEGIPVTVHSLLRLRAPSHGGVYYSRSIGISGLNLRQTGPLTAETLIRWINTIARTGTSEIKRVRVERIGPFQYCPIPLRSVPKSEVLEPGDYGCFEQGTLPYTIGRGF